MPSQSLGDALTKANPNNLADALRMVNLGQFFQPISRAVAPAAPATSVTLDPPALCAATTYVRITSPAGGSAPGICIVGDKDVAVIEPGFDGAFGIASLSEDGTTLTFAGTVAEVLVTYVAAPATSLESSFAFASP